MAEFPITLPAPLLSGYSVAPDNAVIRTDFDSGPARQRQRFTATPQKLEVSWRFTAVHMLAFRVFFKTDIQHGAAWFNMELDIGDGFAIYVVRFTSPYKAAKNNFIWDVTASLEVENA